LGLGKKVGGGDGGLEVGGGDGGLEVGGGDGGLLGDSGRLWSWDISRGRSRCRRWWGRGGGAPWREGVVGGGGGGRRGGGGQVEVEVEAPGCIVSTIGTIGGS